MTTRPRRPGRELALIGPKTREKIVVAYGETLAQRRRRAPAERGEFRDVEQLAGRPVRARLLAPVSLAELDAGDLRDRVPFVGRLERTGEQLLFGDQLSGELGLPG